MLIQSPSLPELHAFVAAARLRSFAQAAEVLCVTPSAVSRAIARMEDQFGCALFTRQGRGSELTAQGQAYFDAVAAAVDALENAAQQAQASGAPTVLKLSVTPTLASHWLIRRLPDFQQRHPDITIEFVPYRPDDYPLLAAQGVSLRGGTGVWPAGVEGDYVVGRQIVPVCKPQALPTMKHLPPCELLRQPLLFHALHTDTWHNWARAVGCAPQDLVPVASFEQVSQLLEAAASGLGMAMVQRCLIEDHLDSGRLAIASPELVHNNRGYYFCYPEVLRRSPAVMALRHWLVEQGAE